MCPLSLSINRCAVRITFALAVLVGARHVMAGDSSCPANFDGDQTVGFADLLQLLASWGPCGACPEDLDASGDVGFQDLLLLLDAWGPCPLGEIVTTELAGNSLEVFPHFEFVRAFHVNETLEIAIDPGTLSARGGGTADVYIVEAKTESQWTSDPALADVRGGPQSLAFIGATIQANTFVLTDSDTLSADAGIDVGVGYDLVCDFNSNGVFDTGDVIDGFSDEAGFYVLHDLTTLGPLTTTSINYDLDLSPYLGPFDNGQRLYYPTDIAALGPRPLVVIGHGGGHNYQWYDYLQEHLASYGYIVVSHENTFSFPPALQRVIMVTEGFIANQDTIAGGAIDGLIDTSRIGWIGHSLGGRAVLLAYDQVFDEAYVPVNFAIEDVKLLCGIASNSLEGPDFRNPHDAPFHLMYGSADGDISGSASCDQCQPLRHYDRAEGYRQATYIHGADHNDFNCCGFPNFQGPPRTEIGPEEAQKIAKAVYLALLKVYLEDNVPARDYFWRQWERFNPIGVSDETIVVNMYSESPASGKRIIDDFQMNDATNLSSSGGAVSFDVMNLVENRLDDSNGSFVWMPIDPMNGMTYGGAQDDTRGIVFDWEDGSNRFLEFEVVQGARDFSQFVSLSFRACQGTQHPFTLAEDADLTFTVTLRDGAGATKSMNIGAYGGGIEETYPRGGGWQNEFETIRLRLTDFLHNGSELDLTDIVAIRFDFGEAWGSSTGRLGFDDLELTTD